MGPARQAQGPSRWRAAALVLAPVIVMVLLYGRAWFAHYQARAQGRNTWAWNAANLGTDETTLEGDVLTLGGRPQRGWRRVRWHGFALYLPLDSVVAFKRPPSEPRMLLVDLGEHEFVLHFEPAEDYRDVGAVDVDLLRAIGNAQYPHYFSSISPDEVSRQYARYLVKGLFGKPPRQLFENEQLVGVLSATAVTMAAPHGLLRLTAEGELPLRVASTAAHAEGPADEHRQEVGRRLREMPDDPVACLEAAGLLADDRLLAQRCSGLMVPL